MISLYRFVPKEAYTLFQFQGDQEDISAIAAICGFAPRRTTLSWSYEQEHYVYLRGHARKQKETAVLAYLEHHYKGPQLEMFRFRGTCALPNDRLPRDWANYLSGRIQAFFAQKHGRICTSGRLGYKVFRANACQVGEGVGIREGISYRLSIVHDFVPVIQTDIAFRFELEGAEVTRTQLYQHCAKEPDVIDALHQIEMRHTDDILKMAQSFLHSLKQIGPEFEFSDKPMHAGEFGWEAWLWAHEHAPRLLGGRRSQLVIPLDMLETRGGFYKLPGEMDLLVLYPDDPNHELFPAVNGKQFDLELRAILDAALPDRTFQHRYVPYPLAGPTDETVELINQQWDNEDFNHLLLMIAPPKEIRQTGNLELQMVGERALQLSRELRRLRFNTYVASCGWDALADEYSRRFAIDTAILKGLTVLGGVPWVVDNMPHPDNCSTDELCFIGIDVNINRETPVAGGVIFDGRGQLCGYRIVRIPMPDGDRINDAELNRLIKGLRKYFHKVTGQTEKHVVIHRDGILGINEALALRALLKDEVSYDLVEIRKSGAARLRQPKNLSGTPSKDIAMGNERLARAFLCNTLSVPETIKARSQVFPAPDSIGVYRCDGTTSIKTLAAQVYLLAQVHHANFHRTVQLPVTTAYADALVNNSRPLKEHELEFGKPIEDGSHPYWL